MCNVIALTVNDRLRERRNIKKKRERGGRIEREKGREMKFLPGALKATAQQMQESFFGLVSISAY